MTRTVVHLLRHGEVHNPARVLYGRLPGFTLSAAGAAQAQIVAAHLADHDVTRVVASPLERAQQTARPVAERHGLEVVTDERLIESGNLLEGSNLAVGDGVWRHPARWPLLRNPFRPSWGEPYLQIAHRMLAAVHGVRASAGGHEAVCVSHQLPIWTLRRYLTGQRLWHHPRRRECSLASLTTLVFDDEEVIDVIYNAPVGPSDPRVTGA